MIRAAIDLGTNTCLLLIAEWDEEQRVVKHVIGDYAVVVRLGEGLDKSGGLSGAAMRRTSNCLRDYSLKVSAAGLALSEVTCVATSQGRDAKNGAEFFEQIEREVGFRFITISGADEARLTFKGGLLPGMDPQNSVVIDIGGGSTEFMSAMSGQSLDIGSVRFTERFLKSDPVKDEEFWAAQAAIDDVIMSLSAWRKMLPKNINCVAVAGTATSLAAWWLGLDKFDATRVDATSLTRGDVHRMVEELKWRTVAERQLLPCVEPGRADVLLCGALILWRAMECLDFASIQVSTRGLRYGVLTRTTI